MRILSKVVKCKSRSDRVEIFPLYDSHIGKRNCNEPAIKAQVREILRQQKKPDRQVSVVLGGDTLDVIKPQDIRFDINEVADWVLEGSADSVRDKLNNIAKAQIDRAVSIFDPIREHIIGELEANHDKAVRKRYNHDTHKDFCKSLGIESMTDEAIIRIDFKLGRNTQQIKIFMRHGYGGGRSPGAEPTKIDAMMADGVTADCDVCLTGHTHTFCKSEPKPVLYIPNSGKIPPRLLSRYRYGLNPGTWLLSHMVGQGTYESAACYPTRPMMACKIVVWPFWHTTIQGSYDHQRPKIEIREYPIL